VECSIVVNHENNQKSSNDEKPNTAQKSSLGLVPWIARRGAGEAPWFQVDIRVTCCWACCLGDTLLRDMSGQPSICSANRLDR